MFDSPKALHKALDANRTMIHDILWGNGFKLLMFAENGPLGFGTSFPVAKPSDLKGRKIRTQEAEHQRNTMKALGASVVPMGITEVLSSLQTGVIEGYTNTILFALAAGLTAETKFWAQTNHILQPGAIVLSRKVWETLPDDLQEALVSDTDEIKKIESRGIKGVWNLFPQLKQNLLDMGIEYTEPDPGPWRAATAKVRDNYRKSATKQGKALFDALVKSS
jgi:TRAP-type C4-dicarboxylate transport system substrate-binding protein